jgi:transposase-like protein
MSHDPLLHPGNGKLAQTVPDPEVTLKAKRRTFPPEYKLRILDEAARCRQPGERGALLRREGLYSSHLTHWRRELREGALAGLKPKKRGPKTAPLAVENANLRREIARLQAKLERAETIIDVQKKLSQLLGLPLPNATDENNGSPQ